LSIPRENEDSNPRRKSGKKKTLRKSKGELGRSGHDKGIGVQWTVYFSADLDERLRSIRAKEVPDISEKISKGYLIRKIVREWLVMKGYL